ncbi:hypothetical protein DL765_000917 [Monosporascus sp. GIB2]|nr:hypothetical protein DL765_000917 [Monosporascus sp. GIB2]
MDGRKGTTELMRRLQCNSSARSSPAKPSGSSQDEFARVPRRTRTPSRPTRRSSIAVTPAGARERYACCGPGCPNVSSMPNPTSSPAATIIVDVISVIRDDAPLLHRMPAPPTSVSGWSELFGRRMYYHGDPAIAPSTISWL